MGVEVQESGAVDTLCIKGHHNKFTIRNLRHELLFESGISALRDGYYREAVANFASALERYLEFQIRVLVAYQNPTVNQAEFTKVWKQMSKQSERQVGAFWMAYFSAFNEAPTPFDKRFLDKRNINLGIEGNDPVHFRNIIIHQGSFATYNQAVSYGEAVSRYIANLVDTGIELAGVGYNNKYLAALIHVAHGAPYDKIGSRNMPTFLNTSPTQVERVSKQSLYDIFPLIP